jgi:uncharacterized protein
MLSRALAALCAVLVFAGVTHAYVSPGAPTGYVNDFADVLSADTKTRLDAELSRFAASTTNEIAVVLVPSLGGDYIEHYAVQLFEEWGIGTDKNDNGVLLLIVPGERQLRIEVGYGLEGALPDSIADRIISDDIVPYLKDGDYDAAVSAGIESIIAATQNEYASPAVSGEEWEEVIGGLFIFGVLAIQWLFAVLARSKSWWLGGVLGLGIGAIMSTWLSWWVFSGALLTLGLMLFGLFFDYVISSTYQHARRYNVDPPWWSGGSGGFGGGRGGGFGGFGGGRSGGGGASGRW